jgi:hypothetical protein
MKAALKLTLTIGVLALAAAPALAVGPGTGTDNRPTVIPPHSGTDNPGTEKRPASTPPVNPGAKRALGKVCAAQGESKSNEGDSEPGTPFSRCVKALARSIRTACKDEPKANANDPERGTPFSRCVVDLAKGMRASTASTDRGIARSACQKADFESGREYGACVRALAKALRNA